MQFLVFGYDGKDADAQARRAAARPDHLVLAAKMTDEGKALYGAAILDDKEQMIGSAMVVEFADRAELDKWLEHEPYVLGKVWVDIDIKPCKVAPMFVGMKPIKA